MEELQFYFLGEGDKFKISFPLIFFGYIAVRVMPQTESRYPKTPFGIDEKCSSLYHEPRYSTYFRLFLHFPKYFVSHYIALYIKGLIKRYSGV